jgi:hypothetical protein
MVRWFLFFRPGTGGELYANRTRCQLDSGFSLALPVPNEFPLKSKQSRRKFFAGGQAA